jgi:hypothetical protein
MATLYNRALTLAHKLAEIGSCWLAMNCSNFVAVLHSNSERDDLSLQVSLVAGARSPLNLEFSWAAA